MRSLLFTVFIFLAAGLAAQSKVQTFEFQKGEVMDIIFLNTKPETDSLQRKYFAEALPVAKKFSYQSLTGFPLRETPMQGNYHPDVMVFGKWAGVEARQNGLRALEAEVDGFHEMRRSIWTTFNMTYWECPDDLTFSVDTDQYNVITALWGSDEEVLPKYTRKWLKEAAQAGGQIRLQLHEGTSPFGYRYAPDLLVMIGWPSREAYDLFRQTAPNVQCASVSHVDEFAIK